VAGACCVAGRACALCFFFLRLWRAVIFFAVGSRGIGGGGSAGCDFWSWDRVGSACVFFRNKRGGALFVAVAGGGGRGVHFGARFFFAVVGSCADFFRNFNRAKL